MSRSCQTVTGVFFIVGFVLDASGWALPASAVPGERVVSDSAEAATEKLLPYQRMLSGEDRVRYEKLDSLQVELGRQARYREAIPLVQEMLEIRLRVQGADHWETGNVIRGLESLARTAALPAEAQVELAEAGRAGPEWIRLSGQGRYREAADISRRMLEVYRRYLGDEHHDVATQLNFLAVQLIQAGDLAEGEALAREGLVIRRKLLGDVHADIAHSLHNLGACLWMRGDYEGAEPLCREAVALWRMIFGEENLFVAHSMGNLAGLLAAKGDCAAAERLQHEVLAMERKLPEDPEDGGYSIALTLKSLANLLLEQGDYAGAEQYQREALAIFRRRFGDDHPRTATSCHDLAEVLRARGNYEAAEALYHEALTVHCKLLGDKHPITAETRCHLGELLHSKGDYAAAETSWVAAAKSFEGARLRRSSGGLQRIAFSAKRSPLAPLAVCLARNGKPEAGWSSLEAGLARGLLDEISARHLRPLNPEERRQDEGLRGRLGKLEERISALLAVEDPTGAAPAKADSLSRERDAVLVELTKFEEDIAAKYGVAAGETYDLARIQRDLVTDEALLAWVDMQGDSSAADPNGEHWACVVRHAGEPVWVKLPGSGRDGAWKDTDDELPGRVREALGPGVSESARQRWQQLVARLYEQRIAPVEPYLTDVDHLIVLPAGWMAGIPVEVLTDRYVASYAPSATMYTWLKGRSAKVREKPGQEERTSFLALGDPTFREPEEPDTLPPDPPEHGVLLAMVMDESNADRSGLEAGDVLLNYGEEALAGPQDLGPAIQRGQEEAIRSGESPVPVQVWRGGQTLDMSVAPGDLGVRESSLPAREAVALERRLDHAVERSRGPSFVPLPGSRLEVEAIAQLFTSDTAEAGSTILVGLDACERRLHALAESEELARYRFIHLATHAVMDNEAAMQSALVLSQDPVDDSYQRALSGEEVYDGRLTAEQIVRTWKLDADLVALSGCETALGKVSGGEGFLGFSQALFVAGARSLVLSLWKVEDTPTMLLMRRFYENLLGRFEEPRHVADQTYEPGSPLPKAEALREAKEWLRGLSWDGVADLVAELGGGGTRGPMLGDVTVVAGDSDYPYEHPHYWAAFILMGNPD